MSPVRRDSAPRKRPTPAPIDVPGASMSESANAKSGIEDTIAIDIEETKQEVLREFRDLLQESKALGDADDMEMLETHFAAALSDVSSADLSRKIESGELKSALGSLGVLLGDTEIESANLGRQIDSAVSSLEQRDTGLALEFSRRLQVEGRDEALAWLHEQQATRAQANAETTAQEPALQPKPLRSEVVQSRSRRLRGPPRT